MVRKVTFTLDEQTLRRLQVAAERLKKPKSEVVRDAIADYHDRIGRLSEVERRRLLSAFDHLVPAIPNRPVEQVTEEIREVRRARRTGGRKRS
jgi:metal-responsive CopG/Arc/MetJ family transcriptional regulator